LKEAQALLKDVTGVGRSLTQVSEFLKEHKTVQELKAILAQQQTEIAALIAHIKEQDAKIQTVSDQLEMSTAAPKVASVK
jgi:predicted nuclease with TOPRIM domain